MPVALSWRKHRVILKKKVFLGKKIGTNHGRLKWVGDTLNMDSYECDHINRAIVSAGTLPFCYYHVSKYHSTHFQMAGNTATTIDHTKGRLLQKEKNNVRPLQRNKLQCCFNQADFRKACSSSKW